MTHSDQPLWIILGRHFFQIFFRLSFLDDAGEESFKRAIIGVLSGFLASGLLLARVYAKKYESLASQPDADLYRSMLPADQLLVICLTMFAIGLVVALVSHSVFPDETDLRILMPLPVSRKTIFIAKFAALCAFAAIFVGTVSLGVGLPFALVSGGRWADHPFVRRASAQVAAGTLASLFVMAAIIALQGLIMLLARRRWLRPVLVATQTAIICSLMLAVPVIVRVPALSPYLAERPVFMYFVPPAWFLGVQEWLLGSRDPYFIRLGMIAAVSAGVVVVLSASCCLLLYRRFDLTVMRNQNGRPPWRWNIPLRWPRRRHPAQEAIQSFLSTTLRRSGLHQLVFAGVFVAGLSLAVNSVLGSMGLRERWLISAVLGAPLTMIAAAAVGLRAALLLPTNVRAAWIFRLTEEAESRPHQLNAVRHTFLGLGIMLPVALAFPLQVGVLGPSSAMACLPIVVLLGSVFVDVTIANWRRIPFACTVLFGKRPAAFTLLVALLAFNAFVIAGTLLQLLALSGLVPWLAVAGFLLLVSAGFGWYRRQVWGRFPLEFEDYLPNGLESLDLHTR
jgi:ABC-type transport system involved in multi-copper enzyme maturation permease subunit